MGWIEDKTGIDYKDPISSMTFGTVDGDQVQGVVNDVTGKTAANAAQQAANTQANAALTGAQLQYNAAQQGREQLERLNSPYINFGSQNIASLQDLIDDPMRYLKKNPMFDAALNRTEEGIKRNQALSGKFNSGGTVDRLFENYLSMGDNFITSRYNQLLAPIQMGQNAASFQGSNVANLLTQGGNALAGGHANAANAYAAGQVGAANARSQGVNNVLTGGAMMMFSDRRLKENIEFARKGEKGLNLYTFNYRGDPSVYVGYMADEVQAVDPDSVTEHENGYLMVSEQYAPERLH